MVASKYTETTVNYNQWWVDLLTYTTTSAGKYKMKWEFYVNINNTSYPTKLDFYRDSSTYEEVRVTNTTYQEISKTYDSIANNKPLKIQGATGTGSVTLKARNIEFLTEQAFVQIDTNLKRGLPRALEEIWDKVSTTLFGFHIDHTWYTGE